MSQPASNANQATQPQPPPNVEPTYQQLAQAFTELQQQLHQTKQQLNAANQRSLPKPAKPNTFNGHPRANPDAWLFEMETYMEVAGVRGNPTRVNFAVAFFREIASTWWSSVKRGSSAPAEWEVFKERFLDRFRPVEASRTARVALFALRQRGSVADYTNAFLRHLQLIPDMAAADQIQTYLKGLQPHIWDEVDMKNPSSLDEAMSYAQRADLRRASRRQVFASSSSRPSSELRPSWSAPRPTMYQTSVPMELGYTSSNEPSEANNRYEEQGHIDSPQEASADPSAQLSAFASRPSTRPAARTPAKLSPEDRERCLRDRLCFRCRRAGHVSARCPTYTDRRPTAQQGKGWGL